MIIIYSRVLKSYIVMKHSTYGRSMIAVDSDINVAISRAISRTIKQ